MPKKRFVLSFLVTLVVVTACSSASTGSAVPSPVDEPSGITGTTRFDVVSGVPGGETTSRPAAIEFAIAPVQAEKPLYERAVFVKSDTQGAFKVALAPGTYWIGAREKALDPTRYVPGEITFSEMTVVVSVGRFVTVSLVQTGYAP
jgi:hypothetical protein